MSKAKILKGNYVGLTIEMGGDSKAKDAEKFWIEIQYVHLIEENWMKTHWDITTELDRYPLFKTQSIVFYYHTIFEAAAGFELLRERVRGLGDFKKLNKSKIPDKRDKKSSGGHEVLQYAPMDVVLIDKEERVITTHRKVLIK